LLFGCGDEPKKYMHKDVYEYMMKKAPEKHFEASIMAEINYFLGLCEEKQCGYPKKNLLRNVSYFFNDVTVDDDLIVGQCLLGYVGMYVDKQEIRVIKINELAKEHGPYSLKAVIYHETVHCLFDYLDHAADEQNLMNAYLQPEWYLEKNLETMINQTLEELRDRSRDERIINQNGNF
jgi:hypothetical protein